MKLWHAGIAVEDLDESIAFWESQGFSLKHRFVKDDPNAEAAMMIDESGLGVELWRFNSEAEINKYVGRHIGFLSDDARTAAKQFINAGFEEVIPFTEGVSVNYVFVQDKYGVYFEIAERKQDANS